MVLPAGGARPRAHPRGHHLGHLLALGHRPRHVLDPAHICIHLGGTLGGLVCGWLVLRATYWGRAEHQAGTVGLWGFRGPLGAWVTIWGALAMLTSAPFDNWWHDAYGLDVKILSPPHSVLAAGMYFHVAGGLLLLLGVQNRSAGSAPPVGRWLFVFAAGILTCLAAIMMTEESLPNRQHGANFYAISCAIYPLFLIATAQAAKVPFPATMIAGTYMALTCAAVWILPLFPATPMLEKSAGNAWGPLVPDHGRLMHLFVMREPELNAFAHLHPVRRSSSTFECALPELPPGRYRIFADVTHESGFAQTLVASVTLDARAGTTPPPSAGSTAGSLIAAPNPTLTASPPASTGITTNRAAEPLRPDVEDSFAISQPDAVPADPRRRSLGEGLTMIWEEPSGPLRRGVPTTLRFRVLDATGQPAKLDAYMGMLSHLILSSADGTVFTHLHPAGTISMASQQVFQIRAGEKPPKRITAAMMDQLCQPPGPEMLQQPISFPYEFPKAARYKFWVQVKVAGQVRTAGYEFAVE